MNKKKIIDFLKSPIMQAICVVIGLLLLIFVFYTNIGKQTTQIEVTPSTVVTDTIKCSTFKFEFDGHDYVKFKTADGEHIIHDPACKCISKKLNNITTVITNNEKKANEELNEKLDKMSVQLKNLKEELDKKPQIIYVSRPAPAKPQVKPKPKVAVKKR